MPFRLLSLILLALLLSACQPAPAPEVPPEPAPLAAPPAPVPPAAPAGFEQAGDSPWTYRLLAPPLHHPGAALPTGASLERLYALADWLRQNAQHHWLLTLRPLPDDPADTRTALTAQRVRLLSAVLEQQGVALSGLDWSGTAEPGPPLELQRVAPESAAP